MQQSTATPEVKAEQKEPEKTAQPEPAKQGEPGQTATPGQNPQEEEGQVKETEVNLKPSEDVIKNYKLKPGDYRVSIKILEASDLLPSNNSALKLFNNKDGAADPYITVEILDQKKKTKVKSKTLHPIYNEQFYFEFKGLITSQLEEASIIFRAMDSNGPLQRDTLIGTFEVDLTTVYFSLNHELYQVTLLLYDPDDKEGGTHGMIQANIEVLGPDDEPNVHNVISEIKCEIGTKNKVLKPAKIKPIGHNIEVNFYRAEHLPVLDPSLSGIDAFCVVKYAGVAKSTKVITSFSPEWNQNIKLACMLPNQSKAVNIEVWDRDLVGSNDLVGTWKVNFSEFRDSYIDARWANIYGPPTSATGEMAETMKLYGYDIGSHYRGRVLYSIGSYNERDPRTKVTNLNFSFPDNPQPVSPQRSYILRIDVLEAHDIPNRDTCIITFNIGPYILKTTPTEISHGRSRIYQALPDKKIIMPVDVNEIPDIIVYFSDKDAEYRRHCFARLKPEEFLNPTEIKLTTIKMKEDKSLNLIEDDEFPGFIFVKIALYSVTPPERKELQNKQAVLIPYQLRVMIFVARDLPAADQEGTSDPFVVIRAAGQMAKTEIVQKTLNPAWYQTLCMDVLLPDLENTEVPEGISILLYDSDAHGNTEGDKELLGRAYLKIEKRLVYYKIGGENLDIIYQKPRWKNIIYDATDSYQGKILVSYALIAEPYIKKIPVECIKPEIKKHSLHFFLIGIRDINMDQFGFFKPVKVDVEFDVCGDEENAERTEKMHIKDNGVTLNLYKMVNIGIPFSPALIPPLDVHLNGYRLGSDKGELLGSTSIDIKACMKNFYARKKPVDANTAAIEGASENPEKETLLRKQTYHNTKEAIVEKDINLKVGERTSTVKIVENVDFFTRTSEEVAVSENDRLKQEKSKLRALDTIEPKTKIMESKTLQNDLAHINDISTFKIRDESRFEQSHHEDFLKVENVELEMKPDMTKGNVGFMEPGKKEKKGFFDKFFSRINKKVIVYEDYDTDPNEKLDVIPDWLVGRETKPDELEDFLKEKDEIEIFTLKRGKVRGKSKLFEAEVRNELLPIASLKAIFLEGENDAKLEMKKQFYQQMLETKKYVCRVYILEGTNIIKENDSNSPPDTYLVVKVGNEVKKDIQQTLRKDTTKPQYYVRYDFVIDLPGTGDMFVEVWHHNKLLKDELIGGTRIDLETRHFNRRWRKYEKKPIEYRVLYGEDDKATHSRIGMWVDLDQVNQRVPVYDISPVEKVECELRVVVWEAKDFEFDDKLTDSSDLFITGTIGDNPTLETDTHWRARGIRDNAIAKATFNWRWKFKVILPVEQDSKGDVFRFQLWDRDLVTSNTMIGEGEIDLNQHNMINKVYKRRTAVKLMKKYKNDKGDYVMTDQIWFNVYHPSKLDDKGDKVSVGKALISFELIPIEEANKKPNSNGRDQPNNYPALPEPIGRFSFDILSPLKTLKEILGPDLYRKICCGICCVLLTIIIVAIAYFVFTTFIGAKLAAPDSGASVDEIKSIVEQTVKNSGTSSSSSSSPSTT